MTALATDLNYNTALDRLGGVLEQVFGPLKSGAKELARHANCNERTAANLIAKRNLPDAMNMLMLMATVPEFAAEVRRLTGMHESLDPEFERDMQALMQTYQRARGQA